MMKIDLMTIGVLQRCLQQGANMANPFIEIQTVQNREEERLSITNGDIDLTSLWFEILHRDNSNQLMYMSQYIGLISDDEGAVNFLKEKGGADCGIGILKVRRDLPEKISEIESMIKTVIGDKGRVFYTFDNADYVVICYDPDGTLEKLITAICNIRSKINKEQVYYSCFWAQGKVTVDSGKIKIDNYKILRQEQLLKHDFLGDGVSVRIAEEIQKEIQTSCKARNKKMASYYHSLFVLINSLAQYEQNPLQKDMFYLLYPQLVLFCEQLEEGRGKLKEYEELYQSATERYEKYTLEENIEKSFSDFLDSVELLLYHIGQTNANIMRPMNDFSHDIPIGLCKMYVAYMNMITRVLLDSEEKHEYRYCLMPVAFSRPETTYFDFGLPPENRLIKVMISKHMMFMPKALMITLAHEVSHYVGPRLRTERAEYLIDMLAIYLTFSMTSVDAAINLKNLSDKESDFWGNYIVTVQKNIYDYLLDELKSRVKNVEAAEGKIVYYLNRLTDVLQEQVREILYDEDEKLKSIIEGINETTIAQLRQMENSATISYEIMRIQKAILMNREKMVAGEITYSFLVDMKYNLREIFADLASNWILQLSPLEYLESFIMVDSCVPNKDTINLKLINRIAIVHNILSEDSRWIKKWEKIPDLIGCGEENRNRVSSEYIKEVYKWTDQYAKILSEEFSSQEAQKENDRSIDLQETNEARKEFFNCLDIVSKEREYCKRCFSAIKDSLQEKGKKEALNVIRALFSCFSMDVEESTAKELFRAYESLQEYYKKDVDKIYSDKMRDLKKKRDNAEVQSEMQENTEE